MFSLLFVVYVVFGAVCLPMYAVSIEHAAQTTYPITEETSSVVLIILANIFGIVFMYGFGYAVQSGFVRVVGYVVAGLYFISACLVGASKTRLYRLSAEMDTM